MKEPTYWRTLSAADRLRLVAFEAILREMPIWMITTIWEEAGKRHRSHASLLHTRTHIRRRVING